MERTQKCRSGGRVFFVRQNGIGVGIANLLALESLQLVWDFGEVNVNERSDLWLGFHSANVAVRV